MDLRPADFRCPKHLAPKPLLHSKHLASLLRSTYRNTKKIRERSPSLDRSSNPRPIPCRRLRFRTPRAARRPGCPSGPRFGHRPRANVRPKVPTDMTSRQIWKIGNIKLFYYGSATNSPAFQSRFFPSLRGFPEDRISEVDILVPKSPGSAPKRARCRQPGPRW